MPLLTLLLASVAGCGPLAQSTVPDAILLSPASLGRTVYAMQQIEAEYDGQSWVMQGALEVAPQALRLVGLTALGQRLITLRWDGVKLFEERDSHLPERVQGERILSDLQLVYWPERALRDGLSAAWRLEVRDGLRVLFYDDKPFINIRCTGADPWQGRCVFEHVRFGYRLTLDSALDQP